MNRTIVRVVTAAVLCLAAGASFADTAQEELQPKPANIGWAEKFEGTGFAAKMPKLGETDYRIVTDYNPQ
jgi:hypothetical protein